MLFFSTQQTISAISRQVYTGNKSTFTSVGTGTGYLRPLSEEKSAVNGMQFGNGFQLITEVSLDIRIGDKLTINSVDYTVRGMANHNRGISLLQYKKYILTL